MIKFILTLSIALTTTLLYSQPTITFQPIITGLSSPVDVVEVNDGTNRLFIVERAGRIKIWNGAVQSTPFLDVTSIVKSGGEQGLLSLAFHPDYATNGFFFIYYTNLAGDITVARYSRANDQSANASSGVVLMNIPKAFTNHNGGKIIFGTDGYLYFGTGDGGSGGDPSNNAQNNTVLLGKMLRIDVNNPNPPYYSIPPTNPFAGSTSARQEIIANGLRNPWRWSFDKQTGDMWLADVGQDQWEEVNVVRAVDILNKNYGWKCFEGTHVYSNCTTPSNLVVPIFDYPHNGTGGYSITGGYVYRGTEFPAVQGYYMFADYVTGNGWLIKSNGSGGFTTVKQTGWINHITSFTERADGTLYAVRLDGAVYKVIAGAPLPVKLVSFNGQNTGGKFQINWQVLNEEQGDVYTIEKRIHPSQPFTEINKTTVTASRNSNNYSLNLDMKEELSYYRLKIVSVTGSVIYSGIITSNINSAKQLKAFISANQVNITTPTGASNVQVIDAIGRIVYSQNKITNLTIQVPLQQISKGILTVRAFINNEWQSVKVVL